MIDLDAIVARVTEIPQFRYVEGILDFAAVVDNPNVTTPAAFVSIGRERAGPNRYGANAIGQRVAAEVSVMVLLGQERADWDVLDPVEGAKVALLTKLVGWQAPGALDPLIYGSWGVRAITDGLVWLEALFPCSYDLRVG